MDFRAAEDGVIDKEDFHIVSGAVSGQNHAVGEDAPQLHRLEIAPMMTFSR